MKIYSRLKQSWQTALSALFWLLLWQAASVIIGEALFLPAPIAVVQAFFVLAKTSLFWPSVLGSLGRISLGFLLGLICGCGFGALAAAFKIVQVLLRPLMLLVRATPVASFTILALAFLSSKNLAVPISFLMALPIFYSGTLTGLKAANKKLLEMTKVFTVPFWRKVSAVYLPTFAPSFFAACELAFGMCWKSGVAAEVIGIAPFSIGGQMHESKIFLQMEDMFAWTAIIILLSCLFGKLVTFLMKYILNHVRFSPFGKKSQWHTD